MGGKEVYSDALLDKDFDRSFPLRPRGLSPGVAVAVIFMQGVTLV